jgi:tRNA-specific 2-thiouridylase
MDQHGNVIGQHRGYYHYTLGQRKGLRIPFRYALYVTKIIPEANTVVVGTKEDIGNRLASVRRINWFLPMRESSRRIQAKVRSRHEKAWAEMKRISDDEVRITFDEPQDAITPGQACVFYDGPRVLGGGWIA